MGDEGLRQAHTPGAVRERLAAGPGRSYLRDAVYGAVDGAVTTFAVVGGIAGARLDVAVLLVLGLANLLADGFSMAASNYLGTRAEEQQRARAEAIERDHVARVPEGEREEIRQIYAEKGFSGEDLERVVAVITADTERWVATMVQEEHGLSTVRRSAPRAAAATFAAFLVAGAVPLLPFVLGVGHAFGWSAALTAASFFAVGAAKARFVDQTWWRSGAETLALGSAAASLAWGVGVLLRGLV